MEKQATKAASGAAGAEPAPVLPQDVAPPAAPQAPVDFYFVCTECGRRHSRMIRQLQEENYCLEECSFCQKTIDVYIEYESNLKLLQIMLCKPAIYRHYFFNYKQQARYVRKCFLRTLGYFVILYWYENRKAHRSEALWENLTSNVTGLEFSHRKTQKVQSQNLNSLYLFDPSSVVHVLLNDFSFLFFIFIQVFLLKVYQRRKATMKSERFFPTELLFWRLWYVFISSQMGYLGVLLLIVWNYNDHFFILLQLRNIYGAFAFLLAVINAPQEKALAVIIMVMATIGQRIVCYTLQPVLLQLILAYSADSSDGAHHGTEDIASIASLSSS